jgi:lambda repressor-like predicted transcriptional regulator
MKTPKNKPIHMPPEEIVVALIRMRKTQAQIAREHGVSRMAISQVVHGRMTSRRLRRAIAEAAGIDVRQIWPSKYLYGAKCSPK